LNEASERFFAIFAVLLSSEDMVLMLKQFYLFEDFLLLNFLSFSEFLNIGSIFEFFFSLLVKFFEVPLLLLFFGGLVRNLVSRVGDFRHGEIGVLVALEGDGLVPIPEIELVKGKLITHIIVYLVTK
jgi:hypothetical protein